MSVQRITQHHTLSQYRSCIAAYAIAVPLYQYSTNRIAPYAISFTVTLSHYYHTPHSSKYKNIP
eukprot:1892129-Rhodomonas_salina.1